MKYWIALLLLLNSSCSLLPSAEPRCRSYNAAEEGKKFAENGRPKIYFDQFVGICKKLDISLDTKAFDESYYASMIENCKNQNRFFKNAFKRTYSGSQKELAEFCKSNSPATTIDYDAVVLDAARAKSLYSGIHSMEEKRSSLQMQSQDTKKYSNDVVLDSLDRYLSEENPQKYDNGIESSNEALKVICRRYGLFVSDLNVLEYSLRQ